MKTWTEEKLTRLRMKARLLGVRVFILGRSKSDSRGMYARVHVDGEFSVHKPGCFVLVSDVGIRWNAVRLSGRVVTMDGLLGWLNRWDATVRPYHEAQPQAQRGKMQGIRIS